jgi:hypothetical protein
MRHVLDRTWLLSTTFGLAMAAPGIGAAGAAFVVALAAFVAVLVGLRFRVASTLAVLLATGSVMLTDAPVLVAGLAGLSAACYLVLRHTQGRVRGEVRAWSPPLVAALGCTVVVASIASMPSIQFVPPWLPLLAPLPVFATYMLAIWPFLPSAHAKGPG